MQAEYAFSERRACGLMEMVVTTNRYRTRRSDEPLRERLVRLAREKLRFGYRRLHVLLRRSGETVNHKRVHRVYCEAGLAIRRRKRKHCVRVGQPLRSWTAANQEWALDFVHDALECGRTIRVLSVVDAYTRECLALEVDTSFASRRVTRVLDEIVAEHGLPKSIRCDNGPEFISKAVEQWAYEHGVSWDFIEPGKPAQNAYVESFNGKFRDECLSENWFTTLVDARQTIEQWRQDYNHTCPHSALGYRTPSEFHAEARALMSPPPRDISPGFLHAVQPAGTLPMVGTRTGAAHASAVLPA